MLNISTFHLDESFKPIHNQKASSKFQNIFLHHLVDFLDLPSSHINQTYLYNIQKYHHSTHHEKIQLQLSNHFFSKLQL